MICGGVQENTWAYDCNFDALRNFSRREEEPTRASRPFVKYRDGLVPSRGCGIVALEEYDQALARGARIHAELLGYATNSDGFDMTPPSGVGYAKCVELALQDAAISVQDIDYINAQQPQPLSETPLRFGPLPRSSARNPMLAPPNP